MKAKVLFLIATFCLIPASWAQNDYFNRINVSQFEFNLGYNEPETNVELYDFLEDTTNFEANDLDGFKFQLKYLYQINNYFSIGGSLSVATEDQEVFDLDFITEGGNDIFQTFETDIVMFGVDAVITPFGSGDRFGSRGWAPKTFVPYLALGAGLKSYNIINDGEFVVDRNSENPDIIFANFEDDGSAFAYKIGAGLRINLSKSIDLNLLYEVEDAEDDLGGDFQGFGDFDLSSETAYVGLRITL
jgi:opacity protein-like surface antigen